MRDNMTSQFQYLCGMRSRILVCLVVVFKIFFGFFFIFGMQELCICDK